MCKQPFKMPEADTLFTMYTKHLVVKVERDGDNRRREREIERFKVNPAIVHPASSCRKTTPRSLAPYRRAFPATPHGATTTCQVQMWPVATGRSPYHPFWHVVQMAIYSTKQLVEKKMVEATTSCREPFHGSCLQKTIFHLFIMFIAVQGPKPWVPWWIFRAGKVTASPPHSFAELRWFDGAMLQRTSFMCCTCVVVTASIYQPQLCRQSAMGSMGFAFLIFVSKKDFVGRNPLPLAEDWSAPTWAWNLRAGGGIVG